MSNLRGKIQVFEIWASKDQISDEALIKGMLRDLVREIDMTPVDDVHIQKYPSQSLGVTAMVAIQHLMESYIIYDNWPEIGYANLVVNSCNPYDSSKVVATLERWFADPVVVTQREPVFYTGGRNG